MITPAEHAATVREALIFARGTRDHDPAVAALDALQAEVTRWQDGYDVAAMRANRAEADRDRLAARVTELEAALLEIADWDVDEGGPAVRVARAALDKDTT